MAAERRDAADLLDDTGLSGNRLINYAQILDIIEKDFNLSWQIGCSVSLVIMILVVASYIP